MDFLTSFVEKIVPSALMALDPFSKLIWLSVWGFISVFYFIPFDVLFFLNPWYCFGYWSFIVNSEVIYDLFTFQHCFGCLGFLEIKRKNCMDVCRHMPQLHVEVRGWLLGVGSSAWVLWSSGLHSRHLPEEPSSCLLCFSIWYCFGYLGFLEVLYEF